MVEAIISHLDGGLPSLEHLSINGIGDDIWDDEIDMLFSQVADSSTKLQSLELSSRFWYRDIGERVFRYSYGLWGIRRLRLMSVEDVPWAEFPNLEYLDYVSVPHYIKPIELNISELVAPRLTGLCLEGDFNSIALPPHALFNQLTHMVLRNFHSHHVEEGTAFPSSFSRLLCLGIQGDEDVSFEYIDTETPLEELILAFQPDTTSYPALYFAEFQPRVLRWDIMSDQRPGDKFGERNALWSRVEELHVTVSEDAPWNWFIPEMSKPADEQYRSRECYPLLHVLTVLYPDNNQTSEQKEKQMEELRGIQRGRNESGFRLLETLKVGWYHPCDHILTIPYMERRVMEWRDCLEGWTPEAGGCFWNF